MAVRLYRTIPGAVLELDEQCVLLKGVDWDDAFRRADPVDWLVRAGGRYPLRLEGDWGDSTTDAEQAAHPQVVGHPDLLPPIGSQEVWAAMLTK